MKEHLKKKSNTGEYIYFIKSISNGLIKIGYTTNINKRFNGLKTMSPVDIELIKVINGDIKKEKDIHEKFKNIRHHGEWFSPSQELLGFIDRKRGVKET